MTINPYVQQNESKAFPPPVQPGFKTKETQVSFTKLISTFVLGGLAAMQSSYNGNQNSFSSNSIMPLGLIFATQIPLACAEVFNPSDTFSLSTRSFESQFPNVAGEEGSGFFAVWQTKDPVSLALTVRGQRFGSKTDKLGDEKLIPMLEVGSESHPCIAANKNSGAVVAWQSRSSDDSNWEIIGQLFDKNGSTDGSNFQISSVGGDSQRTPSCAYLDDKKFVVTWDNGESLVNGAAFNGTSRIGSEFIVSTIAGSYQEYSNTASLGDGSFVVVWEVNGRDGSETGVVGQVFNTTLGRVGATFDVNTFTKGQQSNAKVAKLEGGGFVVVWQNFAMQDGSGSGIYFQLFNNLREKVGGETQANTNTIGNQNFPAIAGLKGGGLVIAWNSQALTGAGIGVFGQIFTASGGKVGDEIQFSPLQATDVTPGFPSLASLDNGGFVVAWQSDSGVYGRTYTPETGSSGKIVPPANPPPSNNNSPKTTTHMNSSMLATSTVTSSASKASQVTQQVLFAALLPHFLRNW